MWWKVRAPLETGFKGETSDLFRRGVGGGQRVPGPTLRRMWALGKGEGRALSLLFLGGMDASFCAGWPDRTRFGLLSKYLSWPFG